MEKLTSLVISYILFAILRSCIHRRRMTSSDLASQRLPELYSCRNECLN
uniref:Uncharacterized protein n=1 Tax=Rhizobium phage IG49 TaxID=3129228 RepID=A0AAU8HZ49_9CAUD